MHALTHVTRIAASTAIFTLCLLFVKQADALSPQNKTSPFHQWLNGFASVVSSSVAGTWRGGKTENDPIHGGYINLSFTFAFGPDGSYQEEAYMGGRKVMTATGTYAQTGNRLAFRPEQCSFSSPDLGEVVKFFPIPTDSPAENTISFSPLGGGVQMSLKDSASGEDWGLKPAQ